LTVRVWDLVAVWLCTWYTPWTTFIVVLEICQILQEFLLVFKPCLIAILIFVAILSKGFNFTEARTALPLTLLAG
jgi:hypothetical protein